MIYAKAFFDLQLHFAERVATLADIPLVDAIFGYTNLYVRFGLGAVPDPAHPGWQAYLADLMTAEDSPTWTYTYYLMRAHTMTGPTIAASVGCFSYALLPDNRIRLHFHNMESDGHSPLAADRVRQRQSELAALFARVKQQVGEDALVSGASWLYNLDAYCRLFPPSYIATERVLSGRFQRMPLWGQFIDRHGAIKEQMRDRFLERLGQQTAVVHLDACFPFQVLMVEASVRDFYRFYAVV